MDALIEGVDDAELKEEFNSFGIVLKNLANGTCRCVYADKSSTVTERSSFVCTQDDMVNFKKNLQKMDIDDHCMRERERQQKMETL